MTSEAERREKEAALGRRRRKLWATDAEWEKVLTYLRFLRSADAKPPKGDPRK